MDLIPSKQFMILSKRNGCAVPQNTENSLCKLGSGNAAVMNVSHLKVFLATVG
jgi:hypothetical protein